MGDTGAADGRTRGDDWEDFSRRSLAFLKARRTVRKFKAGAEGAVRAEDLREAVAAGQRASTSSWIQVRRRCRRVGLSGEPHRHPSSRSVDVGR